MPPSPAGRTSIVDVLTAELTNRIFAHEFKGGERLKESAVAAARGLSRHTVRQALLRLEAERLLTSRNDAGWSLPILGVHDLHDVKLARFAVESTALNKAARLNRPFHRETLDALQKVAQSRGDEDPTELREREFGLRARLVQESASGRLMRMHQTISNELRLWHVQHPYASAPPFRSWQFHHLDLAGAVSAGQTESVARLLLKEFEGK